MLKRKAFQVFVSNIGGSNIIIKGPYHRNGGTAFQPKLGKHFSDFELAVLNNCFEEVFKEIDDVEFHTRIGISLNEARKIQEKIKIAS